MAVVMALALGAQDVPSPAIPPRQALEVWQVGPATCDGGPVRFDRAPRPAIGMRWGGVSRPATYRFRVDETGRPLGIVRDMTDYVQNGEDLAPALAAARMVPGAARTACTLTFTPTAVPIETATREQLIAYTMDPRGGPLPRAGWDRIGSGASCNDAPRPEPLLRAYPDFHTVPGVAGERSWSMVAYDLDRSGRPVGAHVLTGTGNVALDRAATDAVRRSRFTPGARTGCLYPYWRGAVTLAAPEPPTEAAMRPADATCPEHLPFARPPRLTTPAAWNKRNIEGWAVVAYDVAPWGALGNMRVLAAEPSAEFGEWARQVMGGAAKASSTTGYVGCVDRVLFRIGDGERLLVNGADAPAGEGLPPPD